LHRRTRPYSNKIGVLSWRTGQFPSPHLLETFPFPRDQVIAHRLGYLLLRGEVLPPLFVVKEFSDTDFSLFNVTSPARFPFFQSGSDPLSVRFMPFLLTGSCSLLKSKGLPSWLRNFSSGGPLFTN